MHVHAHTRAQPVHRSALAEHVPASVETGRDHAHVQLGAVPVAAHHELDHRHDARVVVALREEFVEERRREDVAGREGPAEVQVGRLETRVEHRVLRQLRPCQDRGSAEAVGQQRSIMPAAWRTNGRNRDHRSKGSGGEGPTAIMDGDGW